MRRLSGWESYADKPREFIEDGLRLKLHPRSLARLKQIEAGDKRQGFVWHTGPEEEDVVSFICGVAIWRALCCGQHSILVGGRPSVASSWQTHLVGAVLPDACSEVRRDLFYAGRQGIRTCNGLWVLRYDGPLADDYMASRDAAAYGDVIFGDYEWIDRELLDAAIADAEHNKALALTVIVGRPDA